jgi:hypothetical protein
MKGSKPSFRESDALNHVDNARAITNDSFEDALRRIQIFDIRGSVTPADMEYMLLNTDISPSALLDLKLSDDPKRRYFPVEKLIETWMPLAEKHGLSDNKILNIVTVLRSFFKYNRIPLLKIECTYSPEPKEPLEEDDLKRFRKEFDFYARVVFDFLLSVPLRDGQFQICPFCNKDFFPRWRNITTYPKIEPYSPFVIKPQKGHENKKYRRAMQVCFLTKTAADDLNTLRSVKEETLGRSLKSDEYIFTHYLPRYGQVHVEPLDTGAIRWYFKSIELKTGIHLTPHFLRSWDNSILAAQGIDKQLRDLYLGHSCAYEMNYIIQLIPRWQQTFRKAKALEALDFMASTRKPDKTELPGVGSPLTAEECEQVRQLLKQASKNGGLGL